MCRWYTRSSRGCVRLGNLLKALEQARQSLLVFFSVTAGGLLLLLHYFVVTGESDR